MIQASYLLGFASCILLLPFVVCSSHEESGNFKGIKENLHKLSPQMISTITLHGLLLWASMGVFMPLGILTIRLSNKSSSGEGRKRVKIIFYLHAIFQSLSVLLATIGAVMSLRSFENSFNNNHQRLGLVLYAAVWVQPLTGFFRPPRGSKRRSTWYLIHWILGTMISLVGIYNIFTGLNAYHEKTSRGVWLWTIVFSAQVFVIGVCYLLQDKWEYLKKQGVILGSNNVESITTTTSDQVIVTTFHQRDNKKVMLPLHCEKKNALRNLFE